MAAPQRRYDNTAGTIGRTIRALLFIVIIIGVVYALYSAAVAINTADKCGGGKLDVQKSWSYFPPEWECGK